MTKAQDVGTRFPFINLEKAVARADQLYQADPRGRPLALGTAFAAWGYSDKSSGGHQTVAALKMYGLAMDSGANEDRRIGLTQAALHYFADEREAERSKALKRFALMPKLIAAVWNEWEAKPPSDNVARSHLKIDRKLNEQSARSFLGIYKDNINYANLGARHTSSDLQEEIKEEIPIKVEVGDFVQWSPNGVDQFPAPLRVRAISADSNWIFVTGSETGIHVSEVTTINKAESEVRNSNIEPPPTLAINEDKSDNRETKSRKDVFSIDEGEVTLIYPSDLSEESYKDIVDWLELIKRKVRRAVR